jgi:hypothetical protein
MPLGRPKVALILTDDERVRLDSLDAGGDAARRDPLEQPRHGESERIGSHNGATHLARVGLQPHRTETPSSRTNNCGAASIAASCS